MPGMDQATAVAWIGSPPVAVLLVLLADATFWHAQLGVQVVVEDYVHNAAVKLPVLIAVMFAAVVLAVACHFAAMRLAFGGWRSGERTGGTHGVSQCINRWATD